jgi:UDP-glucose 4-epimerase
VADLAEAHVLALQNIEGGARSGAYNLGNGHGFSVRQVIDAVERVTELKVPVVLGERRSGHPSILGSDSAKARHLLGWQPKLPELGEIVRSAWAWHQRSPMPETRAARKFAQTL